MGKVEAVLNEVDEHGILNYYYVLLLLCLQSCLYKPLRSVRLFYCDSDPVIVFDLRPPDVTPTLVVLVTLRPCL